MRDLLFPPGSSAGLRVARVVALIIIGVFLLAWLVGAVLWWQGILFNTDRVLSATFFNGWQVEDLRAAATDLGLLPVVFPVYWFGLEALVLAGFGFMSLLLYVRKPDAFGTYLAAAFMFVGTAITGPVLSQVDLLVPGFQTVYTAVLEIASVMVLITILFLFPDGRFVPGWMKWVLPVLLIAIVGTEAFQFLDAGVRTATNISLVGFVPLLLPVILGIASQAYRYVVVSGQRERQLAKGVMLSFLGFILVFVLTSQIAPNVLSQAAPPSGFDLVASMVVFTLISLAVLGVIATITFGVMRQKLWDIDVIIRRTTSYALVTALLVLVYFGSVVLLQRLFTSVTGQTSNAAIVLSTLLIAALFCRCAGVCRTTSTAVFFAGSMMPRKCLTSLPPQSGMKLTWTHSLPNSLVSFRRRCSRSLSACG